MTLPPQASIPVAEVSQVGEARRAAVRLAEAFGFDERTSGEVAIVASELATNLARHAKDGRFFVQALVPATGPCIEMLSVDRGPGMTDVARCLQDGYSTTGTAGNGLGAIRRLSSVFDLHSTPGTGTVVLSRVHRSGPGPAIRPRTVYDWAALSSAAPHELVIGDSWRVAERPGEIAVLVADGLGHGPLAAEAADRAATVVDERPFDEPADLLERAHVALAGSRGAAAALARIDATGTLRYAGVGNIAGSLPAGERSRGLPSQNGTLGVQARRIQALDYEWPGMLIMHSDGLTSRWSLSTYPGLAARHPAIVAGVLWRDCARGRDDATIVVVGRGKAADA